MAPISERAFITALAKLLESDAWPHLEQWWRGKCALRMLDAKDAAERERVAVECGAVGKLTMAIENEVTTNKGMIDGRTQRTRRASRAH